MKPPALAALKKKCDVRSRVLVFLLHAGKGCSVYEISTRTGICYSNVHGSIYGSRGRWSNKKSLLNTGLVRDDCPDGKTTIILLTDEGRKAALLLDEEDDDNDRNDWLVETV